METFKIEITEKLSRIVDIEATSYNEAINKAIQIYEEQGYSDYPQSETADIDINEINEDILLNEFANFVLQEANDILLHLSVEELSRLAFGSLLSGIEKFKALSR